MIHRAPAKPLPLWEAMPPKAPVAHPVHRLHQNSVAAERTVDHDGRRGEVLRVLREAGGPLTDRQVLARLGGADMNEVRPAITRLLDDGVLSEVDSVACPVTGRRVRRVWLREERAR